MRKLAIISPFFLWLLASETLFAQEPILVQVNARFTLATIPWSGPIIENRTGNGILCGDKIIASIDTARFGESITVSDDNSDGGRVEQILFHAPDGGVTIIRNSQARVPQGPSATDKKKSPSDCFSDQEVVAPGAGDLVVVKGRNEQGIVQSKGVMVSSGENMAFTVGGKDRFFVYTIDDKLDPIWYGAPVYLRGKFVGMVAPCEKGKICLLPIRHLKHVVKDIADGTYDGFPKTGFFFSPILNEYHRKIRGLEGQSGGIEVNRITPFRKTEDKILPGDIILALNSNPINSSGMIGKGESAKALEDYVSYMESPEGKVTVLRGRQKLDFNISIRSDPFLSLYRIRTNPVRSYAMIGGIIFQELDLESSRLIPDGEGLLARYRFDNFLTDNLYEQVDSDVMITHFLDDPVNLGYRAQRFSIVKSINSMPVRSLRDLVAAFQSITSGKIQIELRDKVLPIILDANAVREADQKIKTKYNVTVEPQI